LARDVEPAAAAATDVPAAEAAPEYSAAPEASPDAMTQVRGEQYAAPAEEPREGKGSFFRRRRHVGAGR